MSKVLQKNISFEEGWDIIQKAIKNIVEGLPDPHFTSDDYLMLYTAGPFTVFDEMNRQVMDAILAMIDRKRAGEPIDETLVKNALTFYSEIGESTKKNDPKHFAETMIKEKAPFYYDEASNWIASSTFTDNTPKEEKMHDSTSVSSKKINLISSDGEVFEVDFDAALMSKTIKNAIESNSAGDINSISISLLNSEMLTKVIEYCKKHSSTQMSGVDLKDWDAKFVEVDFAILRDLVLSANYLNIKSLLDLVCSKVADTIKAKSPSEIRRMFDFDMKEEDNQ